MSTPPKLVVLSEKIYRELLRLYPPTLIGRGVRPG